MKDFLHFLISLSLYSVHDEQPQSYLSRPILKKFGGDGSRLSPHLFQVLPQSVDCVGLQQPALVWLARGALVLCGYEPCHVSVKLTIEEYGSKLTQAHLRMQYCLSYHCECSLKLYTQLPQMQVNGVALSNILG